MLCLIFTMTFNNIYSKHNKKKAHYQKTILDSFKNNNEISSYILRTRLKQYTFEILKELSFNDSTLENISKKYKVEPVIKLDINHDGAIDLIIIYRALSIDYLYYNSEKKVIKLKHVPGTRGNEILRPVVKNGKLYFEYFNYKFKETNTDWTNKFEMVKLRFHKEEFIELTNHNSKYNIEKLEYSAEGCYGECPIFNMVIEKNRAAIYNAIKYNNRNGVLNAVIDRTSFNKLVYLLNYIDFVKLDSSYNVMHSDDQTCVLKVTYNNGKVKEIRDYGLVGTFGLKSLYDLLFELRETQSWN